MKVNRLVKYIIETFMKIVSNNIIKNLTQNGGILNANVAVNDSSLSLSQQHIRLTHTSDKAAALQRILRF